MMRFLFICLLVFYSASAISNSELIYEAQKKQIQLTEKDKKILEIGEISTTRYVVGGVLGTYPIGFGLGHVVQGRWSEDGAIFTWGELASLAVVLGGLAGCERNGEWDCPGGNQALIVTGFIGFVGFRIWEIVDVWATPISYNEKHESLKKYIENSKSKPDVKSSLDLVPIVNSGMGQGLGFKYTF
jgi:hypothetical protein